MGEGKVFMQTAEDEDHVVLVSGRSIPGVEGIDDGELTKPFQCFCQATGKVQIPPGQTGGASGMGRLNRPPQSRHHIVYLYGMRSDRRAAGTAGPTRPPDGNCWRE